MKLPEPPPVGDVIYYNPGHSDQIYLINGKRVKWLEFINHAKSSGVPHLEYLQACRVLVPPWQLRELLRLYVGRE